MSWATMNGINQTRRSLGMQRVRQPAVNTAPAPQGMGSALAGPAMAAAPRPAQGLGFSNQGFAAPTRGPETRAATAQLYAPDGIEASFQPTPPAYGMQAPQEPFDPNDPRNAALAGYMNR